MYISQESPEQTEARLRIVLSTARLRWWDAAYAFEEYPVDRFPIISIPDALAFVRDDDVWSVLQRATADSTESFGLFSFHFPPGADNSGFVGWLASKLKEALGTGVFVVCGQNSARGGIFDYWGVPIALKADAARVLTRLREARWGANADEPHTENDALSIYENVAPSVGMTNQVLP